MLINDEIQKQLLQLFAKSSNLPKIEAEQQSASQLQLTPGQQVQAEVVAKLPNHLFLARIAGELFKMELPLNVQPGETMHMTFVSAEPRITFELVKPENGRVPVNISTTGKWLSSLVNGAAAEDGKASQIAANIRILDEPPLDTEHFAARLKDVLTGSGLFYESHLAEWARGERQIGQLMSEPQGKLSRRLTMQNLEGAQGANEAHVDLSSRVAEEAANPKVAATVIADPQTLPIIKDQLAVLNSGVILWTGQAWPEQNVEMSVRERESEGPEAGEREWETALRLQMPVLGEITATLRLSGTGLQVVLEAEQATTAAVLHQGSASLKERLQGAGLDLVGMVIKDEKAAE